MVHVVQRQRPARRHHRGRQRRHSPLCGEQQGIRRAAGSRDRHLQAQRDHQARLVDQQKRAHEPPERLQHDRAPGLCEQSLPGRLALQPPRGDRGRGQPPARIRQQHPLHRGDHRRHGRHQDRRRGGVHRHQALRQLHGQDRVELQARQGQGHGPRQGQGAPLPPDRRLRRRLHRLWLDGRGQHQDQRGRHGYLVPREGDDRRAEHPQGPRHQLRHQRGHPRQGRLHHRRRE